jgi:hypothetical protein
MVTNWMTPAVAAAGEAMPKGRELDVKPNEASVTEIVADPATDANVLDTVAFRSVESPYTVGSGVPFH